MSNKNENIDGVVELTTMHNKLIKSAYGMSQDPATIEDAIFQHSVLCQTFLPYRNPGDDVRIWQQKQGNVSLAVQAGGIFNRDNVLEAVGLPYGTKARLILAHINSEAIKAQSRTIDVEGSMSAFIRSIGLNTDGWTIKEVKEQLRRLSSSKLSLGFTDGARGFQYDLQIINAFDLWFPKNDKQRILWPSVVQLSEEYFTSLMNHAIPLDNRALAVLAHNSMALDMYSWLAQRLHRIPVGETHFIAWLSLKAQFGQGYDRMADFKRAFRRNLAMVKSQYSDAKIEEVTNKGFNLRMSSPPIPKITIQGTSFTTPKLLTEDSKES